MTARVVSLVLGVGLLAACGGEAEVSTQPDESALKVSVRASATAAPTTWTLSCDPPGGTHPDPAAACAALSAAKHPFAATPGDRACTEIYGGGQLAEITGSWRGETVKASFTRANGCEIARWDALHVVFPIHVGVAFERQ